MSFAGLNRANPGKRVLSNLGASFERFDMLVHFRSDAGDMIMFGEVAVTLLKMMGQSGDVPGAILAADIPGALARLQGAVAAHPSEALPTEAREGAEPPVSLRQRAFPLIELLTRASNRHADVIWEVEHPLAG